MNFVGLVTYYQNLSVPMQALFIVLLVLSFISFLQFFYSRAPFSNSRSFFLKHADKFYLAAVISFFFRTALAVIVSLFNLSFYDHPVRLIPGTYFIIYLITLGVVFCVYEWIFEQMVKVLFKLFVFYSIYPPSFLVGLFKSFVEYWDLYVLHFYLYSHHKGGKTFSSRLRWFALSWGSIALVLIFPLFINIVGFPEIGMFLMGVQALVVYAYYLYNTSNSWVNNRGYLAYNVWGERLGYFLKALENMDPQLRNGFMANRLSPMEREVFLGCATFNELAGSKPTYMSDRHYRYLSYVISLNMRGGLESVLALVLLNNEKVYGIINKAGFLDEEGLKPRIDEACAFYEKHANTSVVKMAGGPAGEAGDAAMHVIKKTGAYKLHHGHNNGRGGYNGGENGGGGNKHHYEFYNKVYTDFKDATPLTKIGLGTFGLGAGMGLYFAYEYSLDRAHQRTMEAEQLRHDNMMKEIKLKGELKQQGLSHAAIADSKKAMEELKRSLEKNLK
jgi:hypothetical protein